MVAVYGWVTDNGSWLSYCTFQWEFSKHRLAGSLSEKWLAGVVVVVMAGVVGVVIGGDQVIWSNQTETQQKKKNRVLYLLFLLDERGNCV